ncbi:MAG: glycosyltransferase family 39 protein [Candidatus Paceibacterota bacterium]
MTIKKSFKFLFSAKHFYVFLFLVFLASFGYSLIHNIKPAVDARAYDTIAKNLVNFGEYRLGSENTLMEDDSIVKVGPGYEFFLAAVYSIFGEKTWIIWFLQSLFYSLTILILAILIEAFFGKGEREDWKKIYFVLIPAGFFIDMIELNAMLLSESLFIFLTSVSVLIFYSNLEKKDSRKSFFLGFILGILYLVRPVALMILFSFLSVLFFKKEYKTVLAVIFVFSALQVPWISRNYQVYDSILLTHTTAGGVDLLSGNYPGNHGEFRSDFDLYRETEEKSSNQIAFYDNSLKWFLDFAKENPVSLSLVWTEKGIIFWSPTKTGGFWFHYFNSFEQTLTILFSILSYVLIFGTALVYSLKTAKEKAKNTFSKAMIFSMIFLFLVSVITIVSSRYRITLLPFAVILSAGYWFSEKGEISWKMQLAPLLFFTIAASLDLYLQIDKFWQKIGTIIS